MHFDSSSPWRHSTSCVIFLLSSPRRYSTTQHFRRTCMLMRPLWTRGSSSRRRPLAIPRRPLKGSASPSRRRHDAGPPHLAGTDNDAPPPPESRDDAMPPAYSQLTMFECRAVAPSVPSDASRCRLSSRIATCHERLEHYDRHDRHGQAEPYDRYERDERPYRH